MEKDNYFKKNEKLLKKMIEKLKKIALENDLSNELKEKYISKKLSYMMENLEAILKEEKGSGYNLKLRREQKCYYPLHFDPYGNGCYHNCAYCFQKDIYIERGNENGLNNYGRKNAQTVYSVKYLKNIFEEIENENNEEKQLKLIDCNDSAKIIKEEPKYLISQKLPLRIGGVTDPFQEIEKTRKSTCELLGVLNDYDYPAKIVTKSSLIAEDMYLDKLKEKRKNYYVQMTITTLDEELANCLEPGAPSPDERLEALGKLNDKGITTAVRISPLYPMKIYKNVNENLYEEVEKGKLKEILKEVFEMAMKNLITEIKKRGTKIIIVDGLRANFYDKDEDEYKGTVKFINDALEEDEHNRFPKKFDIRDEMKKEGKDFYIKKEELEEQYKKLRNLCNENDLNFIICHHNEEIELDSLEDYICNREMDYGKKMYCGLKGKHKNFIKEKEVVSDFKNTFDSILNDKG
ncbi:hypothetical protein MWH28_09510 [Natroniella sulfidigena]|uniref:SPL family radical SAM protein n=1 Tax=Natroniella sulfidigena TaxID=723921 RepID=UPI00200AB44D|nr:hypothetical protein [Natroniella sulfidigena]MCK8817593.1 hypothetical protein [Natroniella sulfidigena]